MKLARPAVCLLLIGCSSAGPYGYSRSYEPTGEEEDAVESAVEYDPVMVQRRRHEWKRKSVTLFGVVKGRGEGPGGTTRLTLGLRSLSERNLCEEAEEETCRVTVSDREHSVVHVLVRLQRQDEIGKQRVDAGSLLRVVGKVTDENDENDGTPVLRATWYRHWPKNEFVTTAARSYMLR